MILVVWKCKGRPTGDTQGSQMGSIPIQSGKTVVRHDIQNLAVKTRVSSNLTNQMAGVATCPLNINKSLGRVSE